MGTCFKRTFFIFLTFILATVLFKKQVKGIQQSRDKGMNESRQHEHEEVLVISFAYTCAYPGTVMIMHLNTSLTVTAVEWPRWSIDMASSALVNSDLFVANDRYKVLIWTIIPWCRY